jgi:predicted  nucleic acid-binding Zn-ribbon protein
MSFSLGLLYELQIIDTETRERKRRLESLDDGTAARAELAKAEAELAQARERLQRTRTTLRDKELRLASTEEDRKNKHDKCYGGMVSDPKELASLERKIEELTVLIGKLEEEILVLMDRVEEEEEEVKRLADRVERLRSQAEDTEAHYKMETETLQREIEELEARRIELVGQIDPSLVQIYETLREKLGGVAVAGVVEYTCTACHTAVPRDQAERIPFSQSPIRCENCKRILWLVRDE